MKKQILFSLVAASLLIGCGSSAQNNSLDSTSGDSSLTTSQATTTPVDITVERGPVVGAYVIDNRGQRAYNVSGNNYRFKQTPSYPINVYGGYIDVDRDGVIGEKDTKLVLNLALHEHNQTNVTLLTTLAINEELKNELMTTYGLSHEDIYTLTPSDSLEVASISDEVYRYCIENNLSMESFDRVALQGLQGRIESRIESSKTLEGSVVDIVTNNEIELMEQLNVELDTTQVSQAQEIINNTALIPQDPSTIVEAMPVSVLTQTQKDDLLFMYQEEKVARDVYLKLYEKWGLKIFNNIAKAEETHMQGVKALLEKYEIVVPVASDTVGEFDLEELQSLYETLMQKGTLSLTDAIEVGVLVEETDIADLQKRIVDAPEDIKTVYNSLLEGSYNHLAAFNSQLNGTQQTNPRR